MYIKVNKTYGLNTYIKFANFSVNYQFLVSTISKYFGKSIL